MWLPGFPILSSPRATPKDFGAICDWAVPNRPGDRAQLRPERNLCRNQSQRSSSPVAGGIFTDTHSPSDKGLAPCSESSRRTEALISLLLPKKLESRYLGCYGKWGFSSGC